MIAFTSEFIERMVYLSFYQHKLHNPNVEDEMKYAGVNITSSSDAYAAQLFSSFNTSDYPQLGWNLTDMQ